MLILLTSVAQAQTWTSPYARPTAPASAAISPPIPLPPLSSIQMLREPEPTQPVRYQPGVDMGTSDYQIQLEPPGLQRLSRLDSDRTLQERIRQETMGRGASGEYEKVQFPESPILSREKYRGRGNLWQGRQLTVEPNFVCYRKLWFEDKNSERYGWEMGELQPVISVGKFFLDLAQLPMHVGNTLCLGCNECNTGYCLPGDPVPYLLYPPEVTLAGTVTELGTIALLLAIFP